VSSESGGDPNAVSPAGARGLMQVLPTTSRDPGFGIRPSNGTPADDVRVGNEYLAKMHQRYGGDLAKMWGAYHSGPGTVDKLSSAYGQDWWQHLGPQGLAYVDKNLGQVGTR
jgi:soluble lytic murein transglycosylase